MEREDSTFITAEHEGTFIAVRLDQVISYTYIPQQLTLTVRLSREAGSETFKGAVAHALALKLKHLHQKEMVERPLIGK